MVQTAGKAETFSDKSHILDILARVCNFGLYCCSKRPRDKTDATGTDWNAAILLSVNKFINFSTNFSKMK